VESALKSKRKSKKRDNSEGLETESSVMYFSNITLYYFPRFPIEVLPGNQKNKILVQIMESKL
jgi:hypothetical protein